MRKVNEDVFDFTSLILKLFVSSVGSRSRSRKSESFRGEDDKQYGQGAEMAQC